MGQRVSSTHRPYSALPDKLPRTTRSCEILLPGRAICSLGWLFTPWPESEDGVARHVLFGPPPVFRPASTCSGQDRLTSRSPSVARCGGTTPSLTGRRLPGARGQVPVLVPANEHPGCGLSVSLCYGRLRGLNSPRVKTPWSVIRDGTHDIARRASTFRLPEKSSTRVRAYTPWGNLPACFGLFSHPSRGSFRLSINLPGTLSVSGRI